MKQEYTIELVEEYDNVNFYSIHLEGEALTEMEAFFEKFPVGCEYDDEIDVIISWIDKIAEKGARISDGSIVLVDKEIVGNLNFTRYEKK